MKKKKFRLAVTGLCTIISALLVFNAVIGGKLDVEAADTFVGIQNLINEVKDSSEKYTVLEIVPNRDASEIGYLFEGYEPALSVWNESENRWVDWREQLKKCQSEEARRTLIAGMQAKLEQYYDSQGDSNLPVSSFEYDESDTEQEGYEYIALDDGLKTGWFAPAEGSTGQFALTFKSADTYVDGKVYYQVGSETLIESDFMDAIAADTYVYQKDADSKYVLYGVWADVLGMLEGNESEGDSPEDELQNENSEENEELENAAGTDNENLDESATEQTTGTDANVEDIAEPVTESATGTDANVEDMAEPVTESATGTDTNVENSAEPIAATETETSAEDAAEPVVAAETETSIENAAEPVVAAETETSIENTAEPVVAAETETSAENAVESAATEADTNTENTAGSVTEQDASGDGSTEQETEQNASTEGSTESGEEIEFDIATAGFYLVQFVKCDDVTSTNGALYTINTISEKIGGEYNFVVSEDGSGQQYQFASSGVYIKTPFQNNYLFHSNVLNMEQEEYQDFPVEVITYTPDELKGVGADGFPHFDFLYINSGKSAEVNYSKDVCDINDAVWTQLFARVYENQLPCVIDGNILFSQGDDGFEMNTTLQETEIFKLCLALCQKELNNITYESINSTISSKGMNELWLGLAVGSETGHFTTDYVYCHTGERSFMREGFTTYDIFVDAEGASVPAGFQKVLSEIDSENQRREAYNLGVEPAERLPMMSRNISNAVVIQHIMNPEETTQKSVINVLEIQPAKTKDGKPTLTENEVREWAGDSEGNIIETVNITVMTTAEFIGKVETLNDKYDLIYIGTDKSHLNTTEDIPSDAENLGVRGNTVFNDNDMDGLIYYNIGDRRYGTLSLAGQLATEYHPAETNVTEDSQRFLYYYVPVRYNGNDITESKMNELFSYLKAAYPIVLADDFFESAVTFYSDDDHVYNVDFNVGIYDKSTMRKIGLRENDANRIVVREGYKLTVYKTTNCTGNGYVLPASEYVYDLGELADYDLDNKIQSFKIEKSDESSPIRKIEANHIDNSSYIYEFANTAINQYSNIFGASEIAENSALFRFYLNRPKMNMVNLSVNGTNKDDIYYISAVNGRYYLEYNFTIENIGSASANTQYKCRFYIDVNADGRYSFDEELENITITHQGQSVAYDMLYANKQYTVKRAVPDGYKGVLPWKIEISQVNNPNIYCQQNGYTKLTGQAKETIKVLQISRDQILESDYQSWGLGKNEELFSLAEQINGKKTTYVGYDSAGNQKDKNDRSVVRTEAYSTDTLVNGYRNNLYYILVNGGTYNGVTYAGIANDYEIDIDFCTISKFEKELTNFKNGVDANNDGIIDGINLDDYNMLILGFSDLYQDFSGYEDAPNTPLGAIVNFIDSGRSVLMSHDNTSFINIKRSSAGVWDVGVIDRTRSPLLTSNQKNLQGVEYYFSYNLNQVLRQRIGMDRYGLKESSILQAGKALNVNTDADDFEKVKKAGKQVAYKPKSGRTETVPEVHGYTYSLISAKDKRTGNNWQTGDLKYFSEAETGEVGGWYNEYVNLDFGTVHYTDSSRDEGEIPANYNGLIENTWVTQTNKGQITDYPYKLAETFQVANTHGQYYQLDFSADDDGDGQNDLVVWYCLGDRTDSRGNHQETVYSASPNDVANNYYIYSKGNVVYTGMGHSAKDSASRVEEAKLFINTIIAAYNAGLKPPIVTIKEDGSETAYDQTVMYRYYSGDDALDILADPSDKYENVYFTVEDANFVKGDMKLAVNAYYSRYNGEGGVELPGALGLENVGHQDLDEYGRTVSLTNTDFRARFTISNGFTVTKDRGFHFYYSTNMDNVKAVFSYGYNDGEVTVLLPKGENQHVRIDVDDKLWNHFNNTSEAGNICIRFKKDGPKVGDYFTLDSIKCADKEDRPSQNNPLYNEGKGNELHPVANANVDYKTLKVESIKGLYTRYTFPQDLTLEAGKIIKVTYKTNVDNLDAYLSYGNGSIKIQPDRTTISGEEKTIEYDVDAEFINMYNAYKSVENGVFIRFVGEDAVYAYPNNSYLAVSSIKYGESQVASESDGAVHPINGITKRIMGNDVTRITLNGTPSEEIDVGLGVYRASDNVRIEPYELVSGGRYYIKINKELLADCDTGLQIYLEIHSIITTGSGEKTKVRYTNQSYDVLDIVKTYLFNLN